MYVYLCMNDCISILTSWHHQKIIIFITVEKISTLHILQLTCSAVLSLPVMTSREPSEEKFRAAPLPKPELAPAK